MAVGNPDFEWYKVVDNFLTKKQCDNIIADFEEIFSKETAFNNNEYLTKTNNLNTNLFEQKHFELAKKLNKKYFKFDIESFGFQMVRKYECGVFEHRDFHTDYQLEKVSGKPAESTNKLSMLVFLNDDYDGGELQVWYDKIKPKVGRVVVFPTFTPHKVCELIKNNRYTMISWVVGDAFK